MLAAIGRPVRRGTLDALGILGLATRLLALAMRPTSWSGATLAEFFRILRHALLGGLAGTLVVGLLVGAGLVFQGIALADVAGQQALFADVLVRVLVRELAPLLVGLLLLGRTGTVIVAELLALRDAGALRALRLQGVDVVRLLVLPAGIACSLAAFTLGVAFVGVALLAGGALAFLLGSGQFGLLDQLNDVLLAMRAGDILVFPAKLLLAGLLVGVVSAQVTLNAPADAEAGRVLPRAFVRGVLALLVASALLTLVA
jgi:phospholipid/cholesterol/gamma-HCH transport system permease protein